MLRCGGISSATRPPTAVATAAAHMETPKVQRMKTISGAPAVLAPLFISTPPALAAVEDSLASSGALGSPIASLISEYPILTSVAAVVALSGAAFAASLSKPKTLSTGAKDAFQALQQEERTVLVDLRPKALVKKEGVVDLKKADKKALSLVYAKLGADGSPEVDPEFATELRGAGGINPESIVILIDSDGTLAPKAAADVARTGFFREKVYWVRGGVTGPRGWKACQLPTKPYRVLDDLPLAPLELPEVDLATLAGDLRAQLPDVDLSGLGLDVGGTTKRIRGAVVSIAEKYKDDPNLATGILAVAGAAAVGAFAIAEYEAILQVVGVLGLARLVATRLLFAKDRQATLAAVRAFLMDRAFGASPSPSAASAPEAAGALGDHTDTFSGAASLQQLATIVMAAEDAESAAQEITEQMVPDVKGADPAALAAALTAAGVELPAPPPPPSQTAMTSAALPVSGAEAAAAAVAIDAVAADGVAAPAAEEPALVPEADVVVAVALDVTPVTSSSEEAAEAAEFATTAAAQELDSANIL